MARKGNRRRTWEAKPKPSLQRIRARDLKILPGTPIYPGLSEAIGRVMTGEIEAETRRVPIAELVVRDEDLLPELLEIVY